MKIFNKSGSKERLIEMFERVNKISVNEKKNIQNKSLNKKDSQYDEWGRIKKKSRVNEDFNSSEGNEDVRQEVYDELDMRYSPSGKRIPYDEINDVAETYGMDIEDVAQIASQVISDNLNSDDEELIDILKEFEKKLQDSNVNIQNYDFNTLFEVMDNEYSISGEWSKEEVKKAWDKLTKDPNQLNIFKESTDQDKYEDVVFMQGQEADKPLKILSDQGEDAALEYLKQWHEPGSHMGKSELGHGTQDYTYEKDGYIMAWNPRIGYIGLSYDLSKMDESFDSPKEKDEKYLDNSVDSVQDNKYDDGVRYPVEDKLKVNDPSIEGLKGDDLPFKNEDVETKISGNKLLDLANQIQMADSKQEESLVKDFIRANNMSLDLFKSAINYHLNAGKIPPEGDDYYKINDLLHVVSDIESSPVDGKKQKSGVNKGKSATDSKADEIKNILMQNFGVDDASKLSPEQSKELKNIMGFETRKKKHDLSPTHSDKNIEAMKKRDDEKLDFLANNIGMMNNYVSFKQFWNDIKSKFSQETGQNMHHPMAILASLEGMPEDSELRMKLKPLEDALSKQVSDRKEVEEPEMEESEEIKTDQDFTTSQDDIPPIDQAIDEPDAGEEELEGGLADGEEPTKYEPQQILRGMEVEMEHTDDPKVALEIAMDHLEEIPDYYDHLDKMEKEATMGDEASSEDAIDAMGDGQEGEASEEIPSDDSNLEKEVLWGRLDSIQDEPDEIDEYKPRKISEIKEGEIYFNTQNQAVDAAVEKAQQRGFEVTDEDLANSAFIEGWVGYENERRDSIPLYKNGVPQKKMLQISLYRMPSGKYELTTYIN